MCRGRMKRAFEAVAPFRRLIVGPAAGRPRRLGCRHEVVPPDSLFPPFDAIPTHENQPRRNACLCQRGRQWLDQCCGRAAGTDRLGCQPGVESAGGQAGGDAVAPHHKAPRADRGRRGVPGAGAADSGQCGGGRGADGAAAADAGRALAGQYRVAVHAACDRPADRRFSRALSADRAGAAQRRPHRRFAGAAHRSGHPHRPAARFQPACTAAVPYHAPGAGEPGLSGAAWHTATGRGPGGAQPDRLYRAGSSQRLAAAPRAGRELADQPGATRLQRRHRARAGAGRRRDRQPVGLHDWPGPPARRAGGGAGGAAGRRAPADQRGVLPQHRAGFAHHLFSGLSE